MCFNGLTKDNVGIDVECSRKPHYNNEHRKIIKQWD